MCVVVLGFLEDFEVLLVDDCNVGIVVMGGDVVKYLLRCDIYFYCMLWIEYVVR